SYKSRSGGRAGLCRIVASRRQSHHRLTVFPLEMQFRTLAPGVPNPITMLSRATGALLLQTIPESPETFGTWLMRLLLRIAGRPPLAHMPRLFAPPSGLIPETRFRETSPPRLPLVTMPKASPFCPAVATTPETVLSMMSVLSQASIPYAWAWIVDPPVS